MPNRNVTVHIPKTLRATRIPQAARDVARKKVQTARARLDQKRAKKLTRAQQQRRVTNEIQLLLLQPTLYKCPPIVPGPSHVSRDTEARYCGVRDTVLRQSSHSFASRPMRITSRTRTSKSSQRLRWLVWPTRRTYRPPTVVPEGTAMLCSCNSTRISLLSASSAALSRPGLT